MKRGILKRALSAFLVLLFAFSLYSCDEVGGSGKNPKMKYREIEFEYFNTTSILFDYSGLSESEFDALFSEVESEIERYHKLYDARTEYSGVTNIATLNRLAGTGAVRVDPDIIDLLLFSEEMYALTGGKVNYAMGAVTLMWKDLTEPMKSGALPRIPTKEELSEAGKHVSPDSVVIDKANSTVEIKDALLRIDLGAIAKGYTAERIKQRLKSEGYDSIVINMGGNLCILGSKPNGDGWETGIQNPLDSDGSNPYSRIINISNTSLVTSGSYNRYAVINGVSYHHIIDPVTLMPESRYLSVTVQTEDSGVADAFSTAIFNMDFEAASTFVRSYSEPIEVTLVFPDGSVEVVKN